MAEKSCANPRCTCPAEPGKEFCSSNCREARTGAPCSCAHSGMRRQALEVELQRIQRALPPKHLTSDEGVP